MSLATAIAAELGVLVATATMVELSNQRTSVGTEDSARTTKVAEHAAAAVEARLGPCSETDIVAVDLGVRLALVRYAVVYSLTLKGQAQAYIGSVHQELAEEASRRRYEAAIPATATDERDLDEINRMYPATYPKDGQ
jgi:hypothetical protein